MTARQVWEGMLTELSKANAPSLLLHEFNYYFNKAINQYVNKRYNIYDYNQQTTDDLRVLKATTILTPKKTSIDEGVYNALKDKGAGKAKLFDGTWEVTLPPDYLHMLNCICIYKMLKTDKCYNKGDYVDFPATRLTADVWSVVNNNYYYRPLPERPYYYIHNVNKSVDLPTNPVELSDDKLTLVDGTDMSNEYNVATHNNIYIKEYRLSLDGKNWSNYTHEFSDKYTKDKFDRLSNPFKEIISYWDDVEESDYGKIVNPGSNFPRTITVDNNRVISTVERETAQRYGNASLVRCEIRYGRDSSVYELDTVLIDYIKTPLTIRLTKEQVDLTEDTSQIMEFPDYVCLEIINELTLLVMARTGDPRLTTLQAVTTSIANPAQALTPQPQSTKQLLTT